MCGRCGRVLMQGAGGREQGVGGTGESTGDSRQVTAKSASATSTESQITKHESRVTSHRSQRSTAPSHREDGAEDSRAGSPCYAGASETGGAGAASAAVRAHNLCHLCRRGVYAFEVARSFTSYDEHATRAIVLLKHHAIGPLGAWFAARVAETVQREGITADVVVPVPLHRARQRERGHNQAELIARPLAKMLGLPMSAALLVRTKPRPAAHRLTRKERWTSVRGAYGTREGARVDKQRVLLVDDVFTTGATLDACSRALLDAGASGVIGVTVARVVPQWEPLHPSPASTS